MPTASPGTVMLSLILSCPVAYGSSLGSPRPSWPLVDMFLVSLSTISMIMSLARCWHCRLPIRLTGRRPLTLLFSPTILTWHLLLSCRSLMVSPPLPMIKPTVRSGTMICKLSPSLEFEGGLAFAEPRDRSGALWPLPLPFSSMMRNISDLAAALAARLPLILQWRTLPTDSGPSRNCTLAPVVDSTRRRFSPALPIINPTRFLSIGKVSESPSPPLARPGGERSPGTYL